MAETWISTRTEEESPKRGNRLMFRGTRGQFSQNFPPRSLTPLTSQLSKVRLERTRKTASSYVLRLPLWKILMKNNELKRIHVCHDSAFLLMMTWHLDERLNVLWQSLENPALLSRLYDIPAIALSMPLPPTVLLVNPFFLVNNDNFRWIYYSTLTIMGSRNTTK